MDKSISRAVALDVGVFVQAVAALEMDICDVFGISIGILPRNGSEISKKYPIQISNKFELLPKLLKELGIIAPNDMQVFREYEWKGLLDLRNVVCHGKITNVQSFGSSYKLTIAKVDYPKMDKSRGQQRITRAERTLEGSVLNQASYVAEEMADEIEEIRLLIWNRLEGWPDYAYIPSSNLLAPSSCLSGTVE